MLCPNILHPAMPSIFFIHPTIGFVKQAEIRLGSGFDLARLFEYEKKINNVIHNAVQRSQPPWRHKSFSEFNSAVVRTAHIKSFQG